MKFLIYVLLTLNTISLLLSSENPFNKNYELYGITDLSDQAIISSPNQDIYFFGIENEQLVVKKKDIDDEIFKNYIVDFGFNDFDKIIEIESVRLSNSRDILFFIGIIDDIYSLNIIDFNNSDLIQYREDLKTMFNPMEKPRFLRVFNAKEDNIDIIFESGFGIKYILFNNDFTNQFYSPIKSLGISGKALKLLKNHTMDNQFILSVNRQHDDKNELWMLKVENGITKSLHLKDIIDFTKLDYEIINNELVFSISNTIDKQYLNFNFIDMDYTSVKLTLSDLNRGYYEVDGEIQYCLSDKISLIIFPELLKLDSSSKVKHLPDLIHKFPNLTYINYDNNNLNFNYNLGVKTLVLNNQEPYIVVLNNNLIVANKEFETSVLKIFTIGESSIIKLKDFKSKINFNDLNEIYINNSLIKFNELPLYYTFNSGQIFDSDIIPYYFYGYILYKVDGNHFIGSEHL